MTLMKWAFVALALSGSILSLGVRPAAALDSGDDEPLPPSLTLPDGPTIPMPPGAEVFGPQGGRHDPFPQGPEQHSPNAGDGRVRPETGPQAPDADQAPLSDQSPEQRRKVRADELMTRLAQAQDATEAEAILAMIDHLRLQSGSDTADLLMARALSTIEAGDYKLAESVLDKVIALQPTWAEAWNKRATARFLDDDDAASMEDIAHVLALEPRHFGALSGMGYILHRQGDDKDSLTVFRRAAAVDPQNADIKSMIDQLTPEVEGHEL